MYSMLYFFCYNRHGLQAITPDCGLAGAFISGSVEDDKKSEWRNEAGRILDADEASEEAKKTWFVHNRIEMGEDHKSWLDWRDEVYWKTYEE
jgi:hypothetical protein